MWLAARSPLPPSLAMSMPGTVSDEDPMMATALDMTSSENDVAAVRFELDRPLENRGCGGGGGCAV